MSSLTVASYSAGIIYSDTFRRRAVGLAPLLREIWDFDGSFSTSAALSAKLQNTATTRLIQYDQHAGPGGAGIHVPVPRWSGFPAGVTNGEQVHWLVISYLVTHACFLSPIGARAVA
jgi:hypothetical protein